MERHRLEFIVGNPVYAQETEVGKLESIVFSPSENRVVALVVGRGLLLHEDIVVPVEVVREASEDGVWLQCAADELERMEQFRPENYVEAPTAWEGRAELQRQKVLFAIPGIHSGVRSADEGLAKGGERGITISRATRVNSHAGPLGKVRMVLVDGASGLVSHVVVQSEPILGRAVIVPMEWASSVTSEEIFVEADRQQLERLPQYRPDADIAEDVRQALWSVYPIRSMDLETIEVEVKDGVVTLKGNVASPSHRHLAIEAVKKVPGVLQVIDQLIADDDLEAQVAQELAKDEELAGLFLRVDSHLGSVTLEGRVPAQELEQRAVAIAGQVSGVRNVTSHLVVG